MDLAVFYHIWAGGAWREPLQEFQDALSLAGFTGPVFYGAVGEIESVADIQAEAGVTFCVMQRSGYEAVTINAARTYARLHDGAILYAHTKGAAENTEFRGRWRRSMTRRLVADWRTNLQLLEDGADAVGSHWLSTKDFPIGTFGPTMPPFFGGNFWMARCDYLRTLPMCPASPRYEAERWIGLGDPKVVDLLPGWPHDRRWPELCG